MKNRLFTGICALISGLLVAIGPNTVFRICAAKPDGSWMKCHWAGQSELGVGLLIVVLGVFLLIFESQQTRLGLSIAVTFAGVLVVLLPTVLIGGCSMATMNCQRITFPALTVIGILTTAGFAFNSIFLFLTARNQKEGNG